MNLYVHRTMDYSVELPAGRICLCECQVRLVRYHTYSLQYYVVYGMVLVAVKVRRYVSPEVRSEVKRTYQLSLDVIIEQSKCTWCLA